MLINLRKAEKFYRLLLVKEVSVPFCVAGHGSHRTKYQEDSFLIRVTLKENSN